MIQRSTDGIIRVLSLSYGKDSLACLGAIEQLGLPLDRIIHAEVWATQDIPADLPPMMEFKKQRAGQGTSVGHDWLVGSVVPTVVRG